MKAKRESETSKVSQNCLDIEALTRFINKLPKELRIYELQWRCYFKRDKQKALIPEAIKKAGTTSCSTSAGDIDIKGKFKPGMERKDMLEAINKVAEYYHTPVERFHVRFVIIMDKKGTSAISFRRMYKQIRLPNDRRQKKLVLGMVKGEGRDYHAMLAKLSAKKITCTLMKTEKTIVMCSEEVIVK
jgi:hypothetical protein